MPLCGGRPDPQAVLASRTEEQFMAVLPLPATKSTSWPISIGAEGIAAAQFARCGFDVLVQAGRDKPWYDLVVTRGGNLLKISVKASEDGEWALTSGYTRKVAEINGMRTDSRSAIDMWRAGCGSRTVCCLVQFESVAIDELPRIYLASPDEIASAMRDTAQRTGRCTLLEHYEWTASDGARHLQTLPAAWHFSPQRVLDLVLGHPKPIPVQTASAGSPVLASRELVMTV
jgi:hypothetical protein